MMVRDRSTLTKKIAVPIPITGIIAGTIYTHAEHQQNTIVHHKRSALSLIVTISESSALPGRLTVRSNVEHREGSIFY